MTKAKLGVRYLQASVRTMVDTAVSANVKAVHGLQDAIKVDQPDGPGKFQVPRRDDTSRTKVGKALLELTVKIDSHPRPAADVDWQVSQSCVRRLRPTQYG